MTAGGLVLVAHGEAALRESAVEVTRAAGYRVIGVADGESARLILASQPPPCALVVDVALPGALGYELCDEIARAGLPTKVILIASVYSKTAYKRRPSSLYGASDYVEQHHIVDQLVDKLERAVEGESQPFVMRRRHISDTGEHKAAAIREAGEGRLAFRYRGRKEGEERVRSLARLLVADLALYCGDAIEAWRAEGCPGEYPVALAGDIDEARRIFELRAPAELRQAHDYFGEAVHGVLHGTGGGGE
ncbi:MAG TPA: response regulator [Kofleriaceae bacterium]|nr:response regulator [Kofleriaceae bacterium]